ncbi:uncharacterized protein LOC111901360 [Lactuca sativa]|uniref:uncharacterized protein LOC111901360 n=1 Tax=Lactuca sativa TaxID=4236 RepID=UPI000CD9CF0F|nr:uncharacterized protein LOC111901360 [Lactuca sativa]
MEDITLIKDIDSIKEDFTIKVLIICLWTQMSKFDANDTYSIETIMMHEEGRKIHASCLKKWFSRFVRYLKEDTSLYIRKLNVAPNTLSFNFGDPDSKLTLNPYTTVKECENFYGSPHGFPFVDFNIIGHVFEYGRIDTSEQDRSKHKMLMHLQDIEDTKLKVTLWSHNAYYMHDFLVNNNTFAPIVVIVQFAKVKFINGRPFTSTYFDYLDFLLSSFFFLSGLHLFLLFLETRKEKWPNLEKITPGSNALVCNVLEALSFFHKESNGSLTWLMKKKHHFRVPSRDLSSLQL